MDKFSKLFENNEKTWEEDLLELSDIFLELEDQKICRIDYQGGYRTSNGSNSYICVIINDKIEGDIEHVNFMIKTSSKLLLRVTLCEIPHMCPPIISTSNPSFFDKDVDVFINLLKFIDGAKRRMTKYKTNITISRGGEVIYVDFLKN